MMAFYGDNNRRRVVITGMGVVSPLGNDLESTWAGMMRGECGVEPITRYDTTDFPCTVAAFVKDFNPLEYLNKRDVRRMAPFLHFGVAAADQALDHAGLDLSQEDPDRIGIEVGTAIGGAEVVEQQRLILEQQGARKVSPTSIPALRVNMPGCFIAIRHNIRGPVSSSVASGATGISRICEAMRRIVVGDAVAWRVGGPARPITRVGVSSFGRLTAASLPN